MHHSPGVLSFRSGTHAGKQHVLSRAGEQTASVAICCRNVLLHCRVSLLLLGLRIHTLRHGVSWGDTCLRVAGGTAAPLELCGDRAETTEPVSSLGFAPGRGLSAQESLEARCPVTAAVCLTTHHAHQHITTKKQCQCLSSNSRPQVSTDSRDPGRRPFAPQESLPPLSQR